ncbi:hypothetical protein [Nostoc sp. FACHB-190]|uniref:hypothetical protein n=1 Tax=Nostoc sp. FACHB-190 TaxID=2692838 RepID=UPI001F54CA2D|nr:hypothetical protein [Nostoc sp. FACHB-190]
MTLEPNQLNLFPDVTPTPTRRPERLVMSADALLRWKGQILDYQQRVRTILLVTKTCIIAMSCKQQSTLLFGGMPRLSDAHGRS